MFIIFKCRCGRYLYADAGNKTRACPCGRRADLRKAAVLARADDTQSAAEIVRRLQLEGRELTGFKPAG